MSSFQVYRISFHNKNRRNTLKIMLLISGLSQITYHVSTFLKIFELPPPTMPLKGIKPLRISKFYMQMCPSANSIGYVVLTLIKLLSQ